MSPTGAEVIRKIRSQIEEVDPSDVRSALNGNGNGNGHVVILDVRETEAARQSDEVIVLKPGTDAALALAMMHVIVGENRHDLIQPLIDAGHIPLDAQEDRHGRVGRFNHGCNS